METLLTLVIAVGGIATGIGAIWTAWAARRQAKVTERSIAEQTERARLEPRRDVWNAWRDINWPRNPVCGILPHPRRRNRGARRRLCSSSSHDIR
jgi:hypothetical protein